LDKKRDGGKVKFTEFTHNDKWKMKRFPCACCLVKPMCHDTSKCKLINCNIKQLYILIVKEKKCPDCGSKISKKGYYSFICENCGHCFKISQYHKMAWRYV